MKRHPDAPRLRARLRRLIAMGAPPPGRAREIRRLGKRISAITGTSLDAVIYDACKAVVAGWLREDAR